jgi:hypothetical protein
MIKRKEARRETKEAAKKLVSIENVIKELDNKDQVFFSSIALKFCSKRSAR